MHPILQPAFRQALLSNNILRGIFNSLPSPAIAEICARVGYDFLVQDNEHGVSSIETTEQILRATAPYQVPTIVRCLEHDISRVLDAGALGVQIPMVESPEMAERIARICRYPTPGDLTGKRGCAFSGRSATYGLDGGPSYVQASNDSVVVIAMLESTEAISRAAEIASVEGIHGVFVGPNDLAHGMGHLNDWQHPKVQKQIELALRRISDAGKCPGILSISATEDARYRDWGARYLACTTTGLIVKALTQGLRGPSDQGQY